MKNKKKKYFRTLVKEIQEIVVFVFIDLLMLLTFQYECASDCLFIGSTRNVVVYGKKTMKRIMWVHLRNIMNPLQKWKATVSLVHHP